MGVQVLYLESNMKKVMIHLSCEIENLVESHLGKLRFYASIPGIALENYG